MTRRPWFSRLACWISCSLLLAVAAPCAAGQEPLEGKAAEGEGPVPAWTVDWAGMPDQVWVGPQCWANRLQDWCVRDERLTTTDAARKPCRTVHLLTVSAGPEGGLEMGMRIHRQPGPGRAEVGFLVGVGDPARDPRAAALVHCAAGPGAGVFLGLDSKGMGQVRDRESGRPAPAVPEGLPDMWRAGPVDLRLSVAPAVDGVCTYELSAVMVEDQGPLWFRGGQLSAADVEGGLSIAIEPGGPQSARFAIESITAGGEGARRHPERALGPVLSTQYTLSRGVLRMTAQLMPVATPVGEKARLLFDLGVNGWAEVESIGGEVITPGWTASFRVADWPDEVDVPYRVEFAGGSWEGVVRRDPAPDKSLVLAAFTGNHNCARGVEGARFDWVGGMWFPHEDLCERVAAHDPDLLFFSGDQVYEGASPTAPDRANIALDYLYKWFLWCWAYRDLARDRPCLCVPDDHDVYQGNLWGENGRATKKDDKGGYVHPASFVKMVERTQTSHLADPYDPTPVEQGIGVYYGSMLVGSVDFAVLEDRKFKTGCNGRVPPSGSKRADHITDPDFDVRLADVEDARLLGDRQVAFLEDWVGDWSGGARLKVALSQTGFANAATHHGPGLQYLRADLDSNGWPQSGRDRALRVLRKGRVFHVGGDQHLSTIIHHGVDEFGDAAWSFVVPSIANFYPRAWSPLNSGPYLPPPPEEYTGDHLDGLGNRLRVLAATNPGRVTGLEPAKLHDGMPGYGIVRLDPLTRAIRMECWPRAARPRDGDSAQYPGWPRRIQQPDNDGRDPVGWLPQIVVSGLERPVVKVFRESDDALVWAMRATEDRIEVPVYEPGRYRVWVGDPDLGLALTRQGLEPGPASQASRWEVDFSPESDGQVPPAGEPSSTLR